MTFGYFFLFHVDRPNALIQKQCKHEGYGHEEEEAEDDEEEEGI